MNIIQTQFASAAKGPNAVTNVSNDAEARRNSVIEPLALKSDRYSATAANDEVVAKVLSSSINKSFNNSTNVSKLRQSETEQVNEKFVTTNASEFTGSKFDTVTANVVGFVEGALSNLAKRGFNKEELSFFRDEAITGVQVGIDQAKLELIGVANDELYKAIDKTRDSIIGGIYQLPVEPIEYEAIIKANGKRENGTSSELSSIKVVTEKHEDATINFENKAFNQAENESTSRLFTTSSSNISFAIVGGIEQSSQNKLANFINKVDGLANSFYRDDIEKAYKKSLDLGYSDQELIGLAKHLNKPTNSTQIKMYEDIQHLLINDSEAAAPKAVAEYVNKYLDVIDASKTALNGQSDFKQVLNGLVNQMKDVQVPDLLQAINRFHAFNNKFN